MLAVHLRPRNLRGRWRALEWQRLGTPLVDENNFPPSLCAWRGRLGNKLRLQLGSCAEIDYRQGPREEPSQHNCGWGPELKAKNRDKAAVSSVIRGRKQTSLCMGGNRPDLRCRRVKQPRGFFGHTFYNLGAKSGQHRSISCKYPSISLYLKAKPRQTGSNLGSDSSHFARIWSILGKGPKQAKIWSKSPPAWCSSTPTLARSPAGWLGRHHEMGAQALRARADCGGQSA